MLEKLLGTGDGGAAGGLDGRLDALAGGGEQPVELLLRRDAGRDELLAVDEQRVAAPPRRHLVLGFVGLVVALVVAVPAVGLALQEHGALAGAAGGGGVARRGEDRLDVVAVDDLA